MPSVDKKDIHLINQQRPIQRLLNAVIGFFSTLVGISAFLGAIFISPLPIGSNVYAIEWIIILIVVILALLRNWIVYIVLTSLSRSSFLFIISFFRWLSHAVIIFGVSFFIIGVAVTNASMTAVTLGLFLLFVTFSLIFSEPLIPEGVVRIMFGLLFENLDDYENRQQWLKNISRKIESQFKMGNIRVSRNHFVYYFNMELLKGKDVRSDLRNIETWIIDKKSPCFDSIKKIYPEDKFEPWEKDTLTRRLGANPTPLIKYAFFSIVAIILLLTHPELVIEVLKIFGL